MKNSFVGSMIRCAGALSFAAITTVSLDSSATHAQNVAPLNAVPRGNAACWQDVASAVRNNCSSYEVITFMPDIVPNGSYAVTSYVFGQNETSALMCRAAAVSFDETAFWIGPWLNYQTTYYPPNVNLSGTASVTPLTSDNYMVDCDVPPGGYLGTLQIYN